MCRCNRWRKAVTFRVTWPRVAILFVFVTSGAPSLALDEFSFIHMSDTHIPYSNTEDIMLEAKGLGPVQMTPYRITTPPPSFVIVTGDLTEFGGGHGWWEQFLGLMNQIGLPFYCVAGNHDNTWDSCRPRIATRYGAPYYSFDYGGIHFVGLDTASPQDPRPSFGREQLLWLAQDLGGLAAHTPVILFYHHPPSKEFASSYDRYRLYDLLRGHNVVVHLVGHGHGVRAWQEEGYDYAMGGSTFGENAGFAVVDIRDDMLRIAYRRSGESAANVPVLEKTIAPKASPYPVIRLSSPANSSVHKGRISFMGSAEGQCDSVEVLLDDEKSFPLVFANGQFHGEIVPTPELAGAHFYRVFVRGPNNAVAWRGGDFVADTHAHVRVMWRTLLDGSTKSTPAVWDDLVLVGANDNRLYALGRDDGRVRWAFNTGGDILGAPLVVSDHVYVGSGDGRLYEISKYGQVARTFNAGAPVYSSPVYTGSAIIVATAAGTVHAVERRTFRELWRSDAPEYAIEDTLFVGGDTLYFGAWDTYVYALDVSTGALRWRSPASGAREGGAKQYYSAADCGPVVCGERVYIADRRYHLSIMDAATGDLVGSRQNVSGVGLSEDGASVYLRTTNAGLVKLDAGGAEVWTASVPLGYVATAPVEREGVVYSLSSLGILSAVEAASGRVLWTFPALPGFYAMADPTIANGVVYIAGMDGSVTALEPR